MNEATHAPDQNTTTASSNGGGGGGGKEDDPKENENEATEPQVDFSSSSSSSSLPIMNRIMEAEQISPPQAHGLPHKEQNDGGADKKQRLVCCRCSIGVILVAVVVLVSVLVVLVSVLVLQFGNASSSSNDRSDSRNNNVGSTEPITIPTGAPTRQFPTVTSKLSPTDLPETITTTTSPQRSPSITPSRIIIQPPIMVTGLPSQQPEMVSPNDDRDLQQHKRRRKKRKWRRRRNMMMRPTQLPTTTSSPSHFPSRSLAPSQQPSSSENPSQDPSELPTTTTTMPSRLPTAGPTTTRPSMLPTGGPTTAIPTPDPTTSIPTKHPTEQPATAKPTAHPTGRPSTPSPSVHPTLMPVEATTTFYAIGDVPYTTGQRTQLIQQIANIPSNGDFVIHVGDIRSARDQSVPCSRAAYQDVAAILKASPIPVFIVLGDNEWNDCPNPNQGWNFWHQTLQGLEQHWNQTKKFQISRLRPDTFSFVYKSALYIGLNLVGGRILSTAEWESRLTEQAQWTINLIRSNGLPSIIFAHANPRDEHDDFFVPLTNFIQNEWKNRKPVLYLNGDQHRWMFNSSFNGQHNWHRVMLQGGTRDPPVKVKVQSWFNLASNAFLYDRQL